jgi:integrase
MAKIGRIGCVTIEQFKGSIRLRYAVEKKQECLYLTNKDLSNAHLIAATINKDINDKRYDWTKGKYDTKYLDRNHLGLSFKFNVDNFKPIWELYKKDKGHLIQETTKKKKWKYFDRALDTILKDKPLMMFNETLSKRYSLNSILNFYRSCISPALNYAYSLGYIEKLPKIDLPKPTKNNNRLETFNSKEVEEIIKAMDYRYRDYVAFLAHTGRRSEDAKALTWGDVDFTQRRIKFDKAYCMGVTKSTKNNTSIYYPLNDSLYALLMKHKRVEEGASNRKVRPDELVFTTPDGSHINHDNFNSRYWKPTVTQLVLEGKIRFYKGINHLRHFRATQLLQAGIDHQTICKLLETSPAMLHRHYLDWNRDIELPSI